MDSIENTHYALYLICTSTSFILNADYYYYFNIVNGIAKVKILFKKKKDFIRFIC